MGASSITGLRRGAAGSWRAIALIVPIALLLATGMAYAFYLYPPDGRLLLGGTIGLAGIVALALLRYEAAVALGFLLFGVVRWEPAPPDAIFAVVIAIAVVTGRFNVQRVPFVILSLLASFVVLNFLSAAGAVDTAAAARFMLITVYLAVFAIWLADFVRSSKRARLVVRCYVGGAVLWATLTSIALYLPLPGGQHLLEPTGARGTGFFEDPNVYGPFLIPAALIVVEEILSPRYLRAGRLIKILMFCILSTGVILSFSRAAWISLCVALLVQFAVFSMRRGGGRRAAALLAVAIVAAVAVGAVVAVTGSADFLEERAHLQSYDTDRFGAQQQGIRLAEQYPLGIGPGQFDVLADVSTHSTYVRVLAEQGILGFAVMTALLLVTLTLAGRNAMLGRDTYGIGSAALLGAWVSLLINSFVVDTLHWRHLFFVAALIWAGARIPRDDSTQVLPADLSPRATRHTPRGA